MSTSFRRPRVRIALIGLFAGLLAATGAAPSFAATTTAFNATYLDEVTTPRACPPGSPPQAFCFTGVGHGPTTPPGSEGTEQYAGLVDPNSPDPVTRCPQDHNAVSITTARGTLFLTTAGSACGATDNGTWRALGGTGIFQGATGIGTVSTVQTGGGTPATGGKIFSQSTYNGTLTLR